MDIKLAYMYKMNIDGKDVVLIRSSKSKTAFQYNELRDGIPVRAHNFNFLLEETLIGRTFITNGHTYKLLNILLKSVRRGI